MSPMKSKLEVNAETLKRLSEKTFCKWSLESRLKRSEVMKKVWDKRIKIRGKKEGVVSGE